MASGSGNNSGRILKRANQGTIQDKFLVGYQGWFTCAGDGEPIGPGHHGWLHWFNHPIPDGGRPNTDLWPDVSAYAPSELFPAPGLKMKNGESAFLFSSRNAKTVQRHFHWMAEHGVDGAFLQRFAGQCDLEAGNEGVKKIRDEVGHRVREAAEREGRVFAIMYDVSGVPADRIQGILERDWMDLVRKQGVLDSPNYLREKGRPVIALWGFGFHNAGHTPSLVRTIVQFFRTMTPGGAYIMGGAPSAWRLGEGDSDPDPEFKNVWLSEFDAISPWTIGRYSNEQEADNFYETKMKGDYELIKRRNEETGKKVDYIPVVLPGGSGCNLSEGKWTFNGIKRQGGRFLWKQIFNAKRLGIRTMYGAMWDEYDEGTAFMPIVEHKRSLPESDKFQFLALDADGYDVPADWYMRICGFAAEGLRSERRIHETFPVKELQDYWASRPKYEDVNEKSGEFVSGSSKNAEGSSSDSAGDGQTYQEWLAIQKEKKDEPPPPPYSLVEDEPSDAPDAPGVIQQPIQASSSSAQQSLPSSLPPAHLQDGRDELNVPLSQLAAAVLTSSVNVTGLSAVGARPSVDTPSHPASLHPSPHSYTPDTSPHNVGGVFQSQQQQPPIRHGSMGALTNDFGRATISGPVTPNEGHGTARPGPSSPVNHSNAYLANDFGRTTISGPVTPNEGYGPARPGPPSPVNHSNAYNRPSSNPSSPPPQSHRPSNEPISQGPMQNTSPYPNPQWPPPDWNLPSKAEPPSSYPGGANLSRPSTFSASSLNSNGANLRPSATISGGAPSLAQKPPARPHTASGNPGPVSAHGYGNYQPQSAVSEHPPSNLPPRPGMGNHNSSGGYGGPSYPPRRDSSTYTPHQHPQYQHQGPPPASPYPPPSTGPNFPSFPSTSTYGASPSGFPNPTGPSTYPGQHGPSSSYGSNYNWTGPSTTSPHVSPPHSPGSGQPPFSSQYAYNNQTSHGSYDSQDFSFPSALGGENLGFPHTPSGYYGGSPSPPTTYPSTSHYSPPSGFPQPSGSPYPQSSVPGPSGGPWMPSGPSGNPPAFPPRPPSHPASNSYGPPGPSYQAGPPQNANSTPAALNFALSAVGKVAGKKTEQQLGSLAANMLKRF